MAAYLTARPPVRDQWYDTRRRPLTGCTVLHSAENAFDEMGVDTGAEGVAEFCRTRSTPGSYHDIVDSDSEIYLVDYAHGAYHDGTGSNNWALSLSFACRTTDWRRMAPAKRKAMLRNGAKAFLRQQAYRRSIGAPLTELRLITKAQSDAGMSGFTYHGWRDPGRRSDPGTVPPDLFPFDEFITEIRAVLSGEEEDDLMALYGDRSELRTDVYNATWMFPRWQVPGTEREESPRQFVEQTRVEAVRAAMTAARAEALARIAAEGAGIDEARIEQILSEAERRFAAQIAAGYDADLTLTPKPDPATGPGA